MTPPFRIFLLSICLLSSCFTQNRISNQNLAYVYRKDVSMLHPEYYVFHISDSISRLFVSLYSKELLYSRDPGTDEFSAAFQVAYKAFSTVESADLLDSGSVTFTHWSEINFNTLREDGNNIVRWVDMKIKKPASCYVEVVITDVKRNQLSSGYVRVEKQNIHSGQNFFVALNGSENPLFRKFAKPDEEISIRYFLPKDTVLSVHFYNRKFPLPSPPFSVYTPPPFNYTPDSVFLLPVNRNGVASLRMNRSGFFHILADTLQREGFTLFRFSDNFPLATTSGNLLECVRYFTTRKEYGDLIIEENKKAALDKFWLRIGGNPERARSLIKSYYSRVEEANEFFTSHTEGWKSDRGMIYIIFGQPDAVFRSSNSETWTYGEEGAFLSFSFLFLKVRNPFSDNDFQLQRTPVYKNTWYKAVDAWRQGVVY